MVRLIPLFLLFASLPLFVSEPLRDVESVSAAPTATPTPTPPLDLADESYKGLPGCTCPNIGVYSNLAAVKSGDPIKFWVEIDDDDLTVPKYDWTIENGTITSGQGTAVITVRSDQSREEESVKATVELPVYSAMCICPLRFSEEIYFDEQSAHADEVIISGRPAYVTDVLLDAKILTLPCRNGLEPFDGSVVSDNYVVKVSTVAVEPEDDSIVYEYQVSAGQIVGTGPTVQWDLTGILPGTYTVTAAVDDRCGLCGMTKTRTVTIREPDCMSS